MSDGGRPLRSADRGVTPAVAKAMEAAVVVLFLAAATAALYGGAVPAYRTDAGAEVADRTVAAAATQVEAALPPPAREVSVVREVTLPTAIRGANYRIVARGASLALEHPADAVDSRARLALPGRVVRVTGAWESGGAPVVVVEDVPGGVAVRLTDRASLAADGEPGAD